MLGNYGNNDFRIGNLKHQKDQDGDNLGIRIKKLNNWDGDDLAVKIRRKECV